MADNVSFFDGCPVFDVVIHGEVYAHVELQIPGKHNILNALAAAVGSVCAGSARRGGRPWAWQTFHGAGRRFEHKGTYPRRGGLRRLRPPSRRAACPADHRPAPWAMSGSSAPSSPTPTPAPRRCSTTLCEELKLPDVTVLAEIYAAREQNDIGISSQDLAREDPRRRLLLHAWRR